jgi:HSP20 family protein
MANFFEKLKRGMGIEGPVEEEVEEKIEKKLKEESKPPQEEKKTKVPKAKKPSTRAELGAGLEIKVESIETKVEGVAEPAPGPETPVEKEVKEKREKWFEPEGQLAIDIFQTENELVIRSAIAGVKPESVEISFEKDIITIRGRREKPLKEEEDYFSQECYWGPFSREIILPVEVDPNLAEATMKEGILTIRLPKIEREKKKKIIVRG